MNDEKWTRFFRVLVAIAGIMLVVNGVYHSCKRDGSGTANSDATIGTVERLKSEHESIRSEVESGEREVTAAEEHVDRAADAVSRSEDAAARNAASVDELQALIKECQGILETQRGIIRDVDRANGIRPAADAEN